MRKTSKLLMLFTALVWIGWDAAAILVGGPEATLSAVVRDGSDIYAAIPWGLGFLMGHFFGPDIRRRSWVKLTGMGIGVVQLALMFAFPSVFNVIFFGYDLVALAVGVVQGSLQWPQGGVVDDD